MKKKQFKMVEYNGETERMTMEEAIQFCVEYGKDSPMSIWSEESARKALLESIKTDEAVIVDYNGDKFIEMIPL